MSTMITHKTMAEALKPAIEAMPEGDDRDDALAGLVAFGKAPVTIYPLERTNKEMPTFREEVRQTGFGIMAARGRVDQPEKALVTMTLSRLAALAGAVFDAGEKHARERPASAVLAQLTPTEGYYADATIGTLPDDETVGSFPSLR